MSINPLASNVIAQKYRCHKPFETNNLLCQLVLRQCSVLERVLKQALRSSGANATEKHIENVSLCGMFLMEAAHKVDSEFGYTMFHSGVGR